VIPTLSWKRGRQCCLRRRGRQCCLRRRGCRRCYGGVGADVVMEAWVPTAVVEACTATPSCRREWQPCPGGVDADAVLNKRGCQPCPGGVNADLFPWTPTLSWRRWTPTLSRRRGRRRCPGQTWMPTLSWTRGRQCCPGDVDANAVLDRRGCRRCRGRQCSPGHVDADAVLDTWTPTPWTPTLPWRRGCRPRRGGVDANAVLEAGCRRCPGGG
jgi:hypothetical protein